MKYIISLMLILSLVVGCKTSKKVSVTEIKTEAIRVRKEQERAIVKVDSSVQILGVDSYNVVTEILYKTDSSGKTAPVRKTIRKSGVKHKVKSSEHATTAVTEYVQHDSTMAKNESYIKNRDVQRNSYMTGFIITTIVAVVLLIIKMIRMK